MKVAGLVIAVAGSACTVSHLEHNAPGSIHVMTPPIDMANREVEEEHDPGERMILMRYGALAGAGGLILPDSRGAQPSFGVGPEFTVLYGTSSLSHVSDSFPNESLLPDRAFGVSIGWTPLLAPIDAGPLYGELEYATGLAWLTLGWAHEVNARFQGPEGALGIGPLYARLTYLQEGGALLHFGLAFKGQATFVWTAPRSSSQTSRGATSTALRE